VSIIWRRAIHEWVAGGTVFQRWELGDFAKDMRRYLMGETPFPSNMAVVVLVCSDAESRRTWTIPTQFFDAGCLNFAFDVRGIRFRLMMGYLPEWAFSASCRSPLKPIFYGDIGEKTKRGWDHIKLVQAANKDLIPR